MRQTSPASLPLKEGRPQSDRRKNSACPIALKLRSVDNSFDRLPGLSDPTSCVADHQPGLGRIMAKSKKRAKAQKRGKLPRRNKRGKARRVSKAAKATKRMVASAKPKRTAAKKAARRMKQPVAPVVETVAVEVIEQPAPGVIAVTEVEETEVRQAS
jgi:hypothetical protein